MTADDLSRTHRSTAGPAGRARLVRDPRDRVLGGVCAAVARHLDLDVTLVRLAMVLLVIVSGGAGLAAYLLAWILIPQTASGQDRRDDGAGGRGTAVASPDQAPNARAAWRAVGDELRSLGAALRSEPAQAGRDPAAEGDGASRRPLQVADATMTAFGERLRAPDVQAGARRTAEVLSHAVGSSIDQVSHRSRRG